MNDTKALFKSGNRKPLKKESKSLDIELLAYILGIYSRALLPITNGKCIARHSADRGRPRSQRSVEMEGRYTVPCTLLDLGASTTVVQLSQGIHFVIPLSWESQLSSCADGTKHALHISVARRIQTYILISLMSDSPCNQPENCSTIDQVTSEYRLLGYI